MSSPFSATFLSRTSVAKLYVRGADIKLVTLPFGEEVSNVAGDSHRAVTIRSITGELDRFRLRCFTLPSPESTPLDAQDYGTGNGLQATIPYAGNLKRWIDGAWVGAWLDEHSGRTCLSIPAHMMTGIMVIDFA